MRSRGAQRIVHDSIQRHAEHSRGLIPGVLRFAANRAADIAIADTQKLPVVPTNLTLQDNAGNLFFTFGHSAFGGAEVLK